MSGVNREHSNLQGTRRQNIIAATLIGALACIDARAQPADEGAELAKKLANPVSNLVSVPLQYNYDENFGANDVGSKSLLNIQPVVPFSLNEQWNLITRTIVPLVDADNVPQGSSESGFGDIVQSFFFSPKEPIGGWILAAGPVILYPSASHATLGSEKWGAGPTVLALKQEGPWTHGVLANQIWSFAGTQNRADVNLLFVQPFVAFVTKSKTTLGLNTESNYDWQNHQWTVPVNASVSQLLKVGSQIVQLQVGVRYWAESPDDAAEDFGLRLGVTFLFPK